MFQSPSITDRRNVVTCVVSYEKPDSNSRVVAVSLHVIEHISIRIDYKTYKYPMSFMVWMTNLTNSSRLVVESGYRVDPGGLTREIAIGRLITESAKSSNRGEREPFVADPFVEPFERPLA